MADPSPADAFHTAFFYGTLMSPQVLHRVIHGTTTPSALQRQVSPLRTYPALLPHHVRHRVRGCDYPAVLPAATPTSSAEEDASSVRGTLVTGLTAADLWRLDRFEGDEYERRPVDAVILGPGTSTADDADTPQQQQQQPPSIPHHPAAAVVRAETYIWVAGADKLEPREWDFDEFVREKLSRWTGDDGEKEYADVDDAIAAAAAEQSADTMGGRGWNGALGKAIDGSRQAEKEILREAV
ncbi:uncharacterized protein J3D65DRAFT_611650 [Phyllosticta citribraziliensis]|uniref:Putative gamma-glutamylcyclotransferase n=1 Tax=Phyllosticta citribraziliensis TaxID=989973 RepID=A0ABR1MB12_9PEZI